MFVNCLPLATQDQNLNLQYSPSRWSKRFSHSDDVITDFVKVSQEASQRSKEAALHESGLVYGPRKNQRVDIFGANKLPIGAPVFVFVHGGFWVEGSRDYSCVMAKCFYEAGISTAVLGYDLAPTVSLDEIVGEIQEGVNFVTEWANKRNSRVWLCGHSAGAHLISMALSLEQPNYSHIIAGVILISGVYDLEPLLSTYVAKDAALDRETCIRNSPMRLTPKLAENVASSEPEFVLVIPENDSPDFKNQTEVYYQYLRDQNLKCRLLNIPEVDHFDVITNLQFPDFLLSLEIFKLIKDK